MQAGWPAADRCAPSAAVARPIGLTVGGPLEVELRYGLQCWHDGHHAVVLGSGRWSGLLRHLERAGVSSVLELDAARIREQFGNRGEVSFIRRVVDRFRRAELGLDDRHADVWVREVYEQFGAAHRRIPVRMDFTSIERPVAARGRQGGHLGADGAPGGRADLGTPHARARGALRAVGRAAA